MARENTGQLIMVHKKTIFTIFFILFTSIGFCDTTTTNLGLTKPSIRSPAWGAKMNTNLDLIDADSVSQCASGEFLDGAGVCTAGSGAPTTADYLVGTANGSLSAEIAVGTTPGGELGGTWASPTVDDSITVTGWVMGSSTATTPSANDNDTSLATTQYVQTEINAMGGRSLTCSGGSCVADAELYTDKMGARIESAIVEDLDNIFFEPNAITITRVWCITNTSTTDLNIENGSDTNVLSAELVCDTGGQSSCASGCDVNTIQAAQDNVTAFTPFNISISAVAAANTTTVYVVYTKDD